MSCQQDGYLHLADVKLMWLFKVVKHPYSLLKTFQALFDSLWE